MQGTHKRVIVFSLGAVVCCLVCYIGVYIVLQAGLNTDAKSVTNDDYRNTGIEFSVGFENLLSLKNLVFNLEKIPTNKSRSDVFRILLQTASGLKERNFNSIILAYRGDRRFSISGTYFKEIGESYFYENPVYTMRTFTEHVYDMHGELVFGTWAGGWLGILREQLDDFTTFHDMWYAKDCTY